MSFDEKHFQNLLTGVDATSVRIKQISNYISYFRESFHEKIIEIWKSFFLSSSPDVKLLLIFVANEVIVQSSRKGKMEYIIGFGNIFIEMFKDLASKTDSVDILTSLTKLTELWEKEMIYANNFMVFLRQIINAKLKQLDINALGDENSIKTKKINSQLSLISKNELCVKNLELDIEEDNIRRIYEGVDKDRLNKILETVQDPKASSKQAIEEYEERLKELKNILMIDICKREEFILNIADFISQEKEKYFAIEDQSKETNANTNMNNIN